MLPVLRRGLQLGAATFVLAGPASLLGAPHPFAAKPALAQEAEPRITDAVYAVLGVANSVSSRTSYGGTAPDNVRAQAQRWLAALGTA